jgi:outer membrane protein insertion porin family
VTGSLEYRYDFGLSTFATETVVGIVFADVGYASNVPGYDEYGTPFFGGVGIGMQVDLGFGGVALPRIRFDYGFSQRNPGGVFAFRIGTVF